MAQIQQMQGQIDQLAAGLNALNLQIQQAPPAAPAAPPPVRFRLNFDTYSFEGPDPQAAFDNFEQNVRVVSAAMQYPFPDVCNAIIGQLRGRAAQMVRDIVGNYNQFADLNAFLTRLRQIFVSPAYQEKARAAFYLRLQQKGETIIAFHGIMRALWEKAFPADQRQEVTLIRQFIAGLINPKIMEQLHIRNFVTSQEALAEAMRFEGTYEILAMNLRRRENRGQLEPNLHMFLDTNSGVSKQSNLSAPEPMEVDNVNRGQRRNSNYNRLGQHRGRGRGRGRGQQQKRSHPNHNGSSYPPKQDVNTVAKDQCCRCLGFGNWSPDCPNKNQQKPNGRGYSKSYRGNSGKHGY
jgi:hypothetical protein